ncbi:MAG: hypothetical protein KAT15_25230, partial [Bacteroidales bacterium]|nr:hypothetical protein [Bacteroidales bacterium]
GKDSNVIVTSNYKLTFDVVRRRLQGLDAWILILETHGINVWCAAGKGTFGTDELICQIKESQLQNHVFHKRIIVPQLGAPGIAAHKVKEATGFTVKFGPVRAADIKDYISSGFKKNEITRSVQFNLRDRLILAPVELANSLKYLFIALIAVFLLSGFGQEGYSIRLIWQDGLNAGLYLLAAYISGAFLAPVLLPWLPFRQFGGKGLVAGFITFGIIALFNSAEQPGLGITGWFLISGAVSSFLTMNFTGASTYTALSGVRKEMRLFVPLQIALILIGLTLIVISKLIHHG